MTTACPVCGSADTRYRERRGDWFCDAGDHAWAGPPPTADLAGPAAPEPPQAAVKVGAFISYGHADASELALRLHADLAARGVSPVWLDSEMIGPGGLWTLAIEDGIRGADVVLAITSPHSLSRDSICHDEVALAVAEHKRVVPVRAADDPAVRPTLLLVRRSWVDFSTGYEEALERLLRALSGDESGLVTPLGSVAGQRPLDFAFEIADHANGFVGRGWLVDELDAWLASGRGRAFVIVGEPGIGKSAIAAHLASRPDAAAVHFCSTGDADTLAPLAFVANVVVALGARVPAFGAEVARKNPAEPRDDAVTAFQQLVVEPARAIEPPASPQLVIVDALDEAAARQGETIVDLIAAHAQKLPAWLRIVVTSRPEAGVTDLLRALAPREIAASRPENRADVAEYLAARLGALGPDAAAAAGGLADLAAGNFLYAKMAADALEAGTLTIADLRSLPAGIDAFYRTAFRKLFPNARTYLAETAPVLGPLAVAVAPVPFAVLQAASGLDAGDLNLLLSGLRSYLRVEGADAAATYALFHRSLGDWLRDRELAGVHWCDPAAGHARLADALRGEPSSAYAVRGLPVHLAALGRWPELAALLADPGFLAAAWAADQFAVLAAWARVEANSPIRMADAYGPVVEAPGAHSASQASTIATLLQETGHMDPALSLWGYLAGRYRETGDRAGQQASLGGQATILFVRGDLDGAMALFREKERICRDAGDRAGQARSLGSQAVILQTRGDLDGAIALHKEEERICRELGDPAGLQRSLGNQALILHARGDLDGAMALHKEEERICRELGDPAGLQASLGNQALILYDRGDLDGAMALHREEERICRELGNKAGLQASLGNQALILYDRGDLDGAMDLHMEGERICRELGNKDGLQTSLGNQANILHARGDLDGAMALYKEQERICRELGNKDGLQISFNNQALILRARGDLDGAMALHRDQERICRELGNKDGLQASLGNQAVILHARADLDGAMALYKEQERICRELGNKDGLQASLGNQALVLRARGDLDGAMALHKEEERICRELGNWGHLAISLRNQELVLRMGGRAREALPIAEEAWRLASEHGLDDLARELQAVIDELRLELKADPRPPA